MQTSSESTGRIVAIKVDYEVETPEGPRQRTVSLEEMQQHSRPERVQELIDDIELLCEDVVTGRNPEDSSRPVLAVIRGCK